MHDVLMEEKSLYLVFEFLTEDLGAYTNRLIQQKQVMDLYQLKVSSICVFRCYGNISEIVKQE